MRLLVYQHKKDKENSIKLKLIRHRLFDPWITSSAVERMTSVKFNSRQQIP